MYISDALGIVVGFDAIPLQYGGGSPNVLPMDLRTFYIFETRGYGQCNIGELRAEGEKKMPETD